MGILCNVASADGFRVRTEISGNRAWSQLSSLDTALGFQNRSTTSASARIMWDKTAGPFRFEVHSHLAASHGGNVAYSTAIAPFVPAALPATALDLTTVLHSSSDTNLANTIDRLSITYSNENLVLKLGRQAITWGSGMVFHPNDIVAPFAPDAIDTAYKPGADMVYAQYLFDNGADIQIIAVPRATTLAGKISNGASTYALRAQFPLGALDSSVMLARDRGDDIASFGVSGPLGGASWNAEYVGWRLADGTTHPSWLVNISNFATLGAMNISYYGEYFHNGFGVASTVALDSLPASLSKRMSTGQVFLAGQDFMAIGANLQMTPDLTLAPNAIISLNDGSTLASIGVNYTLGDNTNLVFNYQQPIGAPGTEFGGRETSAGSGIFGTSSQSATLQLIHFF